MPGRLSNIDVHVMLDNRFGAGAVAAPPVTYYLGLSTTTPVVDGTGITEPVGGNYARIPITNNVTNWPAAAARQKANGAAFTFPTATANWGHVTHFVLFDAATGGVMRAYGQLANVGATPGVSIATGETRAFPAGSLLIQAPST